MADETIFCSNCGAEGGRENAYCTSCGASIKPTGRKLAGHIGFLLNELALEPMRSAIQPAEMRGILDRHYRGEIARILGVGPAPVAAAAAPAMAAPIAPAPATSVPMITAPVRSRRAVPPVVAPLPAAREPYDWSWLAEQQANLFLFAGAFLTVIAALIYVGYSGQAVGGGLKMSLLAGYTLAFLAGGLACRRIERVEMAGNVFFAIGAILVPLNFIAARSIFSDEEISAESMWLAGSIVSALFYAAVAWLGLGRAYTLAAGAAILSATGAALYVSAAPVEWWPLAIIATGFVMTLTQISAPDEMRRRLGDVWSPMGQLAAAAAVAAAPAIAALDAIDDVDIASTPWFLPVTLGVFTLSATYVARGTMWQHAAFAALAGFAATWISVAYAMGWPAEGYAITIALLAVALIAGDAFARRGQLTGIAPVQTGGVLYAASLIAASTSVLMSLFILSEAHGDTTPYILASRWFVLGVTAPLLAVAAIDAFVLRTRFGPVALPIAAGATASAALYGWSVGPEWHAVVIAATAAITAAASRFATASADGRLHGDWREDALVVARIGAGSAALFGLLAAINAGSDAPDIALSTRWYLAITLGLVALTAAIDTRTRLGVVALPIAIAATVSSSLWALDLPIEWHAVSIAATAAAFAASARFGDTRIDAWTNADWRFDTMFVARGSAFGAAVLALVVAGAASGDAPEITLSTRWYLAIALGLVALTFAIDTRTRLGVIALTIATAATAWAPLWALDVSIEWYPVALAATAAAFAAAARFGDIRIDAWTNAAWRDDTMIVARAGAVCSALIALMVAGDASDGTPVVLDTRWFLAITFAFASAVALIDATRKAMRETTAALAAGIIATVLACVWRFDAPVATYGVALAATGIALAASGRIVKLPWIDGAARDVVAVGAIGVATVPFWPAYADDGRSGAAVHLAAAAAFALGAIMDRSERSLALTTTDRVRLSVGWLYAATFSAIAGYVFVLRSMPAGDGAESGSLAMPLLAAAIAVAAVGAAAKRWRPDFSIHLYASALLTAAIALSLAPDMQTLAILLTVITAVSAAIALYENQPLLAAPAAAAGAAAILSWHIALDASPYALPLLYTAAALALYAIGFALQGTASTRRWSDALRGVGGAFALIAPVAAYALMSNEISDGVIDGARWYESPLYQATIAAVAIVGVIALAEASIANRRWIIVPASAVMLAALLMQIGRFNPDNVQAYTAVIGFYFVALGAFGLGRFRLLPGLEPAATSFEALGAATIIMPTFIQSFSDGWHYDALLITESAAFLAAGIALRRRGVLSVALFFLVAAGGRALFDAISAMPNWIVAMTAGIALLAIGFAILAGRERWDRWQETVIRWWGETGNGHAPS